jgi:hypothetical protein
VELEELPPFGVSSWVQNGIWTSISTNSNWFSVLSWFDSSSLTIEVPFLTFLTVLDLDDKILVINEVEVSSLSVSGNNVEVLVHSQTVSWV